MLVLNRKPQEKIRIGDDISITVLSLSGQSVRLGFEAPSDTRVYREEVYLRQGDGPGRRDD